MPRKKKEEPEETEESTEEVEEEPEEEAEEEKVEEEPEEEAEEEKVEEEVKEEAEGPERKMFKIKCAECGKDAEVPFKPDGSRPVYCRDCFMKRRTPRRSFGRF